MPVDAGLGSRAPVGCCLSREGLAVAGRDWIVAAGAVALADASPQMTSLSLKGTVCLLFERLSDGLCGLAWSARPVGGGGKAGSEFAFVRRDFCGLHGWQEH